MSLLSNRPTGSSYSISSLFKSVDLPEKESGSKGESVVLCSELISNAVVVATGFVLCLLIFAPRFRKSDNGKLVKSHVSAKALNVYTKAEVSLHNRRTDCWIIIKNKVYDVTSYVEEHPGGDAILAHAGDDSTEGFFGPQHATRVFDLIEDFYIGDLVK
ncbi:Cytochrome B5-like protein [Striga hermonthica]|uniref:Cytochrome B5-like protein n=1 Tax=Striga hermonthica TaxID=68872 RepID=A0A9N7NWI6_STRHE|nr:Cytochrome B5-like protein [Striga hermonthica]